jgi:uncharacterized protein
MANSPGSFVWYELFTPDADAAQRFYADVVGWTVHPSQVPGMDYRVVESPEGDAVGGLMQPPPGIEGPTTWRGYVEVADVDAAVADITGAGGAVHLPPMDVPNVGRLAMLADPQGATFYVIASSGPPARAFQASDQATPGHATWNELAAPDPAAAIAFYADRFGWRQEGAMPMGPLGDYQFLHHGDVVIGAAMPVVMKARPGWQVYFHVADIDAAADRLKAGGGSVIQGPDQIPGGHYAVVAEDPAGARFGLVGPRVGGEAA